MKEVEFNSLTISICGASFVSTGMTCIPKDLNALLKLADPANNSRMTASCTKRGECSEGPNSFGSWPTLGASSSELAACS